MKNKARFFIVVVILINMLLAACTAKVETFYVKVQDSYESIESVAALKTFLNGRDPVTLDDADLAKFVEIWGDAKYISSSKQTAGYQQVNRLKVGTFQIGVIHYQGKPVNLPPRVYKNIPQGDDELLIKDALCLRPGQIAYQYEYLAKENEPGKMIVRIAQTECYRVPIEGWEIEHALKIEQGQLAWNQKTDGTIQILNAPGIYPDQFMKNWQVEPYLVVGVDELAWRMTNDGKYEFRIPNPGVYMEEMKSRWNLDKAVQVGSSQFGIFVESDGTVVYLSPGTHFNTVPILTKIYTLEELRYRTLDTKVFDENYDTACQSAPIQCGTVITRINFADSDRQAEFNVDVGVRVLDPKGSPAKLEMFRNFGDLIKAVIDNVEGPTRDNLRSVCSGMNQEQLESPEGKAECESRTQKKIQEGIDGKGIPLIITYVNIRSRNFNDDALRTAAAESELALQKQQDAIKIAEAEKAASEARLQMVMAQAAEFEQTLNMIKALVNLEDGVSCEELILLASAGLITIDWTAVPASVCTQGNINVDVSTGK